MADVRPGTPAIRCFRLSYVREMSAGKGLSILGAQRSVRSTLKDLSRSGCLEEISCFYWFLRTYVPEHKSHDSENHCHGLESILH